MNEQRINILKKMSLQRKKDFITKYCLLDKLKNLKYTSNETKKIKSRIDYFIDSLDEDYKKIFYENFIRKESNPYWYLDNWSKNSYYKKLNYLVNLFIEYVNYI
ncbi:hypothetical protein DMC14_001685 [Metamycoplasma phocicerebrale]|uniref:Uncharacterized protein n=1 Tax=Metamycoplasma phocicerebrale TaxID=142649 RepID=A0A3Q9V5E0_9BACT|nr:hypothetical protein [Metamycoplasma phocicerebrale]AZZ65495.1 hypothetical protein DMC14_001685 [Metamycoplasma phocicerebrale]